VVSRKGQVARVLQTCLRPPASREQRSDRHEEDRTHEECGTTPPGPPQRRN